MNDKISAARAQAEAKFKKPYDGTESGPALTAHETELRAMQERTAKLKALRLAKEEAERAMAPIKQRSK